MLQGDFRQCPQCILDSLARREKAECQKHRPPGDTKVVLVKIWIRKRDVRYAVGNDGYFVIRDPVDIAEHFRSMIRHHNELSGAFYNL